jgi:uncharacterized membrane protein YqiK
VDVEQVQPGEVRHVTEEAPPAVVVAEETGSGPVAVPVAVEATAEAEAIKIQAEAIQQQGGASYVNLKAVEKWDGHLPAQMIPGGALPFLNLQTQGVK